MSGQIPTFKKFYTGLVDVKAVAPEKGEETSKLLSISSTESSKLNFQEEVSFVIHLV